MTWEDDVLAFEVRRRRKYWHYIGLLLMWPIHFLGGRTASGRWNDFILRQGGCEIRFNGKDWFALSDGSGTGTSAAVTAERRRDF